MTDIVTWIKKNYILIVYIGVSFIGIILFIILAPFKGSLLLQWINMENNSDWTMLDYFRSVLWDQSLPDAYKIHSLYPPLAVLSYHYIAKITSLTGITDYSTEMAAAVSDMPYQMMVYITYMSVGLMLIFYAVSELNISKPKRDIISIGGVLSAPMVAGALERGNCVIYSVAFILLAVVWRDSHSKVKRELALISIALSAGIKIYPAIMGLLYIREKRFCECFRLIIYGLFTVFVPFIFVGGLDSLKLFINALLDRSGTIGVGRIQCFKGLIVTLLNNSESPIINITYMLFIVILFALLFISKDKVRVHVYCAAFMAMVPTNAFRYTLLFFLLAVFALFESDEKGNNNSIDSVIITLLLASIFTIPTIWGLITGFKMNYGFYTCTSVEAALYFPAWTLVFYCMIRDIFDGWYCWRRTIQNKFLEKSNL